MVWEGESEGSEENVEELERVEEGWTGPRERRERAKSGSEASRFMAVRGAWLALISGEGMRYMEERLFSVRLGDRDLVCVVEGINRLVLLSSRLSLVWF